MFACKEKVSHYTPAIMRRRSFFSAFLTLVLLVGQVMLVQGIDNAQLLDNEFGFGETATYEVISKSMMHVKKPSKDCDDEDDCEPAYSGSGDDDHRIKAGLSSQNRKNTAPVDAFVANDLSDSLSSYDDNKATYEVIFKSMMRPKKDCDDEDDCKPSSSGDGEEGVNVKDGTSSESSTSDAKYEIVKKGFSAAKTQVNVPHDAFATNGALSETSNRIYEVISKSMLIPGKPTLPKKDCDDEDDCQPSSGSGEESENENVIRGLSPPKEKGIFNVIEGQPRERTFQVISKSMMFRCDDKDGCQPLKAGTKSDGDRKDIQNNELHDSYAVSNEASSPAQLQPEPKREGVPSLVPFFLGSSFLVFPPLGNAAKDYLKAEVEIKPVRNTGLILYNGMDEQVKTRGDFISLSLQNGFVELSFNCGSGSVKIRSLKAIAINKWHKVRFYRSARLGSLTVNEDIPVFGVSPGSFSVLSLYQNLSVGGVPHHLKREMKENVGVSSGFTGYIRNLKIKGHVLDLVSRAIAGNIKDEKKHLCSPSPCKNGASCVARDVNLHPVAFNKDSYLRFKKPALLKILKGGNGVLTFSVKTKKSTGLILYEYQKVKDNLKRYAIVRLRFGHIFLSFDTGFGTRLVNSTVPINDGLWHEVTVERKEASGALVIDKKYRMEFKSPASLFRTKRNIDLFIGGVPTDIAKETEVKDLQGFDGCLRKFRMEYLGYLEYVDLVHDAISAKDTGHCTHH